MICINKQKGMIDLLIDIPVLKCKRKCETSISDYRKEVNNEPNRK